MIAGMLGKKIGMTQIFQEDGSMVPVTVIEAGPCHVMQVKTKEHDGYDAVQLGFDDRKRKNATKPESGHARKAKVEPKRFVREIRADGDVELELGEAVTLDIFDDTASLDVTGISKGKGFQGVMKRHNFKGGPASHGAHRIHRMPGSIGQSAWPSRTLKGMRMGGQMGNKRSTVTNLKIVDIDKEKNLLIVKGAVPGHMGTYLILRSRTMKKG
jgi:large subunit ribosomal protein L3